MTERKPRRRLGRLGDVEAADDTPPKHKLPESHDPLDIDPRVGEQRWTEQPAPIHEVFYGTSNDAARRQRPPTEPEGNDSDD